MATREVPVTQQPSIFASAAGRVSCAWISGGEGPPHRLRKAQVGATWALASHLTLSDEPAVAVLPTGVGKTAIISLLPFLVPATRVLVVVPSKLIRRQVVAELSSLKTLRRCSAIPNEVRSPRTVEIKKRIATTQTWEGLRQYEVVVGIPASISGAVPGVADVPEDLFDLILVDEAHHVPATTWTWLINKFPMAKRCFLTATPFRADRKPIPGRIVFTYSISSALDDGVFAPVEFTRVEPPAEAGQRDAHLATAAVARLRSPEHSATGSLLLVRTSRKVHAEELVDVYEAAGARLGLLLANAGPRKTDAVLRGLGDGSLDGLVTVGVIGEGFDEPRLKIAAYHRPHRSLPPTLQFLGRLSRVRPKGGPAELLAYADAVADETRELYDEDASWGTLVPRLAGGRR